MLAHLILRMHSWPLEQTFEPCFQMEDCLEMMFGRIKTIKSDVKGSTTVGNAISAAHLIHTRQLRKPSEARFRNVLGVIWQ